VEENYKSITGDRIRYLRKKHKIKIPYILNTLDISRSTLTGWETGRRKVNGNALVRLAEILETTVDYLTGNTDEETTMDINELKNILNSSTLTYDGKPITEEQADNLKKVISALLNK